MLRNNNNRAENSDCNNDNGIIKSIYPSLHSFIVKCEKNDMENLASSVKLTIQNRRQQSQFKLGGNGSKSCSSLTELDYKKSYSRTKKNLPNSQLEVLAEAVSSIIEDDTLVISTVKEGDSSMTASKEALSIDTDDIDKEIMSFYKSKKKY